jgi:hypothetical protein
MVDERRLADTARYILIRNRMTFVVVLLATTCAFAGTQGDLAEGEGCTQSHAMATGPGGLVLSCKEGKWVADGAIWGSQWSADPSFLLQQALLDATRGGTQCETNAVGIRRDGVHTSVIVAATANRDDAETSVRKQLGDQAVPIYQKAIAWVADANSHGHLVGPEKWNQLTNGSGYSVVTEGVCAERVSEATH